MQDGNQQKYYRLGITETIVIVSLLFFGGPDMSSNVILGCTFIAIAGGLCSLGSYIARHVLQSCLGERYTLVQTIIVIVTIGVVFIGSYISESDVDKTILKAILNGIPVVIVSGLPWLAMYAGRNMLPRRRK